jgi:hypothetical protein
MEKYRKFLFVVVACANVFVAVAAVHLCWKFHRYWDGPDQISHIDDKFKVELLRLQYYGWMPTLAVLLVVSSFLLWRARKS